DHGGRRTLGGQCDEGSPNAERAQELDGGVIKDAKLARIVDAAARRVEEWAFNVNAEHAGRAALDGRAHSRDGAGDEVQFIADQGRQKAGGAETAMGRADGCYRIDGGMVV